jgi:transposase
MSNNPKSLPIIHERVDDLPVLLAQLREMGVPELLNQAIKIHGNWRGLSFGHLVTIWLVFVLSESNHRLSHLQPWAAQHLHTLQTSLGVALVATDFTDDRLAQALRYLSDDAGWHRFEDWLNQRLLRVYDLTGGTIRLDSTTAKSYGTITPDGLLQLGHSKDQRPDLPQLKINLSTLDPLGLPLTVTVTNGACADDPLYVPEIERVRATLARRGLLYVGDGKMAARATRVKVAAGGDFYLCPLPIKQLSAAELAALVEPVRHGQQATTVVWRRNEASGKKEKLALGYELAVPLADVQDGQPVCYAERRLVVRSLAQARAEEKSLRARLRLAQTKIRALGQPKQGKRCPQTEAEWRAAVDAILTKQRVTDLLEVRFAVTRQERHRRVCRARPARTEVTETVTVQMEVPTEALARACFLTGWRVYATNAPVAQLSLAQAVLAYRGSYLIERGFHRLKGHALALTPMYLTTPQHLTGLVRGLLIGLRVLGLLEYKARQALAASGAKLAGLTKGLPKKATARPTAEALLQAFDGQALFQVNGQWYQTPLTTLQRQILKLLNFSADIYHCLLVPISEAHLKMRET